MLIRTPDVVSIKPKHNLFFGGGRAALNLTCKLLNEPSTCDSGRVPDAILMSSQAGRAFLEVTEVTVLEVSELRHVHHFTVGKPLRTVNKDTRQGF